MIVAWPVMAEACAVVQDPAGSIASTGAPVHNAHLVQPASADVQDAAATESAHQGKPQEQQGSRVPLQGEYAPTGASNQVNQQSQQGCSEAQHGNGGDASGESSQQGHQQAQQGASEPQAGAASGADVGTTQHAQQGSRELRAGSDRAAAIDVECSLEGVLEELQRRADAKSCRCTHRPYMCILGCQVRMRANMHDCM